MSARSWPAVLAPAMGRRGAARPCWRAAPAAGPAPPRRRAAATAPLATSMTTADGATWAILAMGGAAADENQFWELFTRPAGNGQWELVTPPGVADNGGLVASGGGGRSPSRSGRARA